MIERLINVIRRHGFRGSLALVPKNVAHFLRAMRSSSDPDDSNGVDFDQRFGVETTEIREIGSLKIESENARHAVRYQPTDVELFTGALNAFALDFEALTFVDYGCGKGRVLLLASEHPFKRIIGIEFVRELYDTAVRNVEGYRGASRRCMDISVVCMDAASFELPSGALFCYFYNPFGAAVMQGVVSNIEKALRAENRDIYILYVTPEHKSLFLSSGLWETLGETSEYLMLRSDASADLKAHSARRA